MKSTRLLPLLVCVLAACGDLLGGGGGDDDGVAGSVAELRWGAAVPSRFPGGLEVALRVQAVDTLGQPVPGVQVSFSPVNTLSGSFDGANARTTTNGEGVAETRWTSGANQGEQRVWASVVGGSAKQMLTLNADAPAAPPRFVQRAIYLAGPVCSAEGEVRNVPQSVLVGFSGGDTTVIRPAGINIHTGSYSWQFRGFIAVAPGTAQIFATDIYGRRDTLTVTVGTEKHRIDLPDTIRVDAGRGTLIFPTVIGTCGDAVRGTPRGYVVWNDSIRTSTSWSSPDVFTVQKPGGPDGNIYITGLKAGTGKLVQTFWGSSDSAVVVVR